MFMLRQKLFSFSKKRFSKYCNGTGKVIFKENLQKLITLTY